MIYDNFGTFRRVISSRMDLSFLKSVEYLFFSIQTAHYVRRFRHMADMIIAIVLLSLKNGVLLYMKKTLIL